MAYILVVVLLDLVCNNLTDSFSTGGFSDGFSVSVIPIANRLLCLSVGEEAAAAAAEGGDAPTDLMTASLPAAAVHALQLNSARSAVVAGNRLQFPHAAGGGVVYSRRSCSQDGRSRRQQRPPLVMPQLSSGHHPMSTSLYVPRSQARPLPRKPRPRSISPNRVRSLICG